MLKKKKDFVILVALREAFLVNINFVLTRLPNLQMQIWFQDS